MLIEPQPAKLLARICNTLEATALANMTTPYAQRQLKAGLYALRDIGTRVAAQPKWIQDDIDDMSAILASFGIDVSESTTPDLSPAQRHLLLQARIESFETQLFSPLAKPMADAAVRELHALYGRMLAREGNARASCLDGASARAAADR